MLRYYKLWTSIGWLMVFLLSYFSLISNPPEFNVDFKNFDKVRHAISYFFLMFWFSQIYQTSKSRMFYAVFFVLLGIALEILQGIGGVRYFEYYDMLANTFGIVFAWIVTQGKLKNILFSIEKIFIKN